MISLKSIKWFDLFFCLLSALLLSLSFPKFDLWFLAWVGLLPLFFAIKSKRPISSFLLSYFTGFLFFLFTVYWIIHVTLLGYLLLVIYLAIYFGIFGLAVSFFSQKSTILKLLIFPSIWVLLEFLRGHILTGFGWAFLGYSQYQILPIIQISDITGVYGVSFIIVMANTIIFEIFLNPRAKENNFPLKLMILILILSLGYGFLRINAKTDSQKIKISVIQGNIPEDIKWDSGSWEYIVDRYIELSQRARQDKPDIIIWPETAFPGYFKEAPFLQDRLINSIKEINRFFLVGAITVEDSKIYNSATLISPEGNILETYHKLHLVPFGEYVPFHNFFSFLPQLAALGDFTPGRDFTVFFLGKDRTRSFSSLICFEDTIPELSRQFVKNGAHFLVNITDDSWFKDTSAPYQHLQASVFRAVENRTPLVRAANTGVSAFIDAKGEILAKINNLENKETFIAGYKTKDIKLRNCMSFYSRFGDVFVLFCLALLVLLPLLARGKDV